MSGRYYSRGSRDIVDERDRPVREERYRYEEPRRYERRGAETRGGRAVPCAGKKQGALDIAVGRLLVPVSSAPFHIASPRMCIS